MNMHLVVDELLQRPGRRMAASAVMLVFMAVFFALPLYAAMSICAMPCCTHAAQTTALSSGMAGCATPCAVTADDTAEPAAVTVTPQRTTTLVATIATTVVAATIAPPGDTSYTSTPPRAHDAPLHVLNSIFRI